MENIAISRKQIGGESPIVASQLLDDCVYTGLFGTIDSARMEAITAKLTTMIESSTNRFVIIDLSNVEAIDTSVAIQLLRVADTIILVGSTPIFCGIKGVIARTMVSAGVSLGQHIIEKNLKAALDHCFYRAGYKLIKINHDE